MWLWVLWMSKRISPYTGAQRLVKLYERLLTGEPMNPTDYARSTGVKRQTVYYQLTMLSACGIPVINLSYGKWTLLEFADKGYKNDGLY
jgi:predicted DNA-binding transcriptional regulator YafY